MKTMFPFYSIGHFINQPHNPTEFEITLFEEMEEPEVDDPHKHSFYEIIWVDKGKSRQVIDYLVYEVGPGNLFFISPNQLHHFEEWKPIKGGCIMFTEDFFLLNHPNKDKLFELSFLDNFHANPYIQLTKRHFDETRQLIDMIFKEQHRKDKQLGITQSLLHILLANVQRSINISKPVISKKYLILYKQFKSLLDEHFLENKSADFYAAQLNITPHHLNLVAKHVTAKTASEIIRARSMLEAMRLLTFTGNSVSEIAAYLNYFDSSYFAKLFRVAKGNSQYNAYKWM